jgi:DNA-binding CsgD family transcriptional regulator
VGLDPGNDLEFPLTPSLAGANHELAGLRAWHAGDATAAAVAFQAGAGAWAGFHEPRSLLCRWAAAESERRAGAGSVAVGRLEAAMADARTMGFQALATRLARSLRLAGVREAAPARTPVPAPGGLTARERELVGLVELGLTNLEIARRLGLGQPTVTRILGAAMTKLGVSSRAQLAARVPR